MLKSIIIKKWLEPYVILETFKKNFECKDITFDGFSKQQAKTELFKSIEGSKNFVFGLYLKNVNKFYLMSADKEVDVIDDILKKEFVLNSQDYDIVAGSEDAISRIDLARAEFSIIIKNLAQIEK